MKKRMNTLRRVLTGALFLALLLGALAGVSRVVERKASRTRFEPFLSEPEEFDVLFIGDSLVVNGVFPMELWQDYGIAAYNLASYGNTLPVTYWTLMNALEAASPRLVVVGVKDVEKDYKLSGSSSDVHTALDCYPLTLTKICAVNDLMDDPYAVDDSGVRYADMKLEYLFTLGKYHSRWSELSTSDFGGYTLNRQKARRPARASLPHGIMTSSMRSRRPRAAAGAMSTCAASSMCARTGGLRFCSSTCRISPRRRSRWLPTPCAISRRNTAWATSTL